jgi:hypothetical protein
VATETKLRPSLKKEGFFMSKEDRGDIDQFDPFDSEKVAIALGARIGAEVIKVSGLTEALQIFTQRQGEMRLEYRRRRAANLVADVTANLIPRFKSSGGRPTVPEWQIWKKTSLTQVTWDSLGEVSDLAAANGHAVSPSQIASYLIEKGLAGYEE